MANREVKIDDTLIRDLLARFTEGTFVVINKDMSDDCYMDKCKELWELDYYCEELYYEPTHWVTYPEKILVPIFEKDSSGRILETTCPDNRVRMRGSETTLANDCSTETIEPYDYVQSLKEPLRHSTIARCRRRAPVPVILCNRKYVARSSTLSTLAEVAIKLTTNETAAITAEVNRVVAESTSLVDGCVNASATVLHGCIGATINVGTHAGQVALRFVKQTIQDTPELEEEARKSSPVDYAREKDIELLNLLKISMIMDLMVEKKKLKYGLFCSSSEKIDRFNRYASFKIIGIPYPGCEFHRKFFDNGLQSKGIEFDWTQYEIDAILLLPQDPAQDSIPSKVTDDWENYKDWDFQLLTKNYLKLALLYIVHKESPDSGLLVHCISGWDRTPVVISLIRLSLWADGLVHSSFSVKQMLFFTLAYDWYFFGHALKTRLDKGEFIMCFLFEFLSEIVEESFSMISLIPDSNETVAQTPTEVVNEDKQPLSFNICTPLAETSSSDDKENYISLKEKSPGKAMGKSPGKAMGKSPKTTLLEQNQPERSLKQSDNEEPTLPEERTRSRLESTSSLGSWSDIGDQSSTSILDDSLELEDYVTPFEEVGADSERETKLLVRKRKLLALKKMFFKVFINVYQQKPFGPKNEPLNILPGALDQFL